MSRSCWLGRTAVTTCREGIHGPACPPDFGCQPREADGNAVDEGSQVGRRLFGGQEAEVEHAVDALSAVSTRP